MWVRVRKGEQQSVERQLRPKQTQTLKVVRVLELMEVTELAKEEEARSLRRLLRP
jgi:hypothetical protein